MLQNLFRCPRLFTASPSRVYISTGSRFFTSTLQRPQRYSRFGEDPGHGAPSYRFRSIRWDTSTKVLTGLGVFAASYYIAHLEQVPETGRWRYMNVSKNFQKTAANQSLQAVLNEYKGKFLPPDHPLVRGVTGVADKILKTAGLGHVKGVFAPGLEAAMQDEWEVFVIHDTKNANAFVIPGRKIFVFTGLFQVATTDDSLAAVLSHEIAHQVARHPEENASNLNVLFVLGLILQTIVGLDAGLSNLALQLFLQLPNSRAQETEADMIGINLMSKSCFDLQAAVTFWRNLNRVNPQNGFLNMEFASTHPAHLKRAQNIEKWIPEVRSRSPCIEADDFARFNSALAKQSVPSLGSESNLHDPWAKDDINE